MSMIEKFLEEKHMLRKDLDAVKDEMLKIASAKADKRIDEFIAGVKVMVAEASDEEFVEFITSGKLDDEDLNAVIMFRAQVKRREEAKVCDEHCGQSNEPDEKHEPRVHVFVLEV